MPGWMELSSYSLWTTLVFGSLTAFSFWGVGRLSCGRALSQVPDFLRRPAECVAGVLVIGMLAELLAMCGASRPPAMQALWMAGVVASVIALFCSRRAAAAAGGRWQPSWPWAPAGVMGLALLLAGAAPESRSDELAYHTLASARPLMDGGLRLYALPWEASILPQLLWHFALTPLYAISGSAAGGVASAWLAILLGWAAGRLLQWQSGSDAVAAAGAFIALAGGYAIVFFTTTGPHAFGYLAVFVAVAAVGWSSEMRATAGSRAYALTIALGCAGAITSKITMLPVAAIISCLALVDTTREATPRRVTNAAWIVLLPAVALLVPVVWAWAAGGSPLGTLTARMFHATLFDPESLSAYQGTRELFASRFQWRFEAAYWSVPLALGAGLALWIEPVPPRRRRWWLIAGCQALLIAVWLPHELRHFGGIQYPLMASGVASVVARARSRGYSFNRIAAVGAMAAIPWALFVLWVASIYLPLAAGRMTPGEFLRRYSGLQSDYEALDKQLPPDAKILIGRSHSDSLQYAWYSRPPVYYAPRSVLFGASQVKQGEHVYLFYLGAGAQGTQGPIPLDPWLPAGYSLGRCVYSNPEARFYPSRTPGGNAGLARLDVFELVRH